MSLKYLTNMKTFYMQAANYLDIKSLLDLTCAKVASMFKENKFEEIRKQFNKDNESRVKQKK